MAGVLVLVVGPSGAGKDTLIAGARAALAADERYFFPRRIITRDVVAELEDHDTVTPEAFELARRRSAYALDWEAHGLLYAIPATIEGALVVGRVVVANVSRQILTAAREKYPRTEVLLVTARPEVRAARLAARGRESAEDIAARLAREGEPVPRGLMPTIIDNSGALEVSLRGMLMTLRRFAR
jgi:phosphonate metabolism protein PhnN/1,5-bisphosphokinase (PRPP-forming)